MNRPWRTGERVSVNVTGRGGDSGDEWMAQFQHCLVEGIVASAARELVRIDFGPGKGTGLCLSSHVAHARQRDQQEEAVWKPGDWVEVYRDGNWWEAKINGPMQDGQWPVEYLIAYDVGEESECLNPEDIRTESINSSKKLNLRPFIRRKKRSRSERREEERVDGKIESENDDQNDMFDEDYENDGLYEDEEEADRSVSSVAESVQISESRDLRNDLGLMNADAVAPVVVAPVVVAVHETITEACFPIFYRNYQHYRTKDIARTNDEIEAFVEEVDSFLQGIDSEAEIVRRRNANVSVVKVLDHRVWFFQDVSEEPLEAGFVQEWFLVQASSGRRRWVALRNMQEISEGWLKVFYMKEFEKVEQLLNEFIGLEKVKKCIKEMLNQLQAQSRLGRERVEAYLNMQLAFLGNPGTGKTEIAKIIPRLYWLLGKLRYGHMLKITGAELEGNYEGQTSHRVRNILRITKGGCLFLDEAYSLISGRDGSDEYGKKALATLLSATPSEKRLVIIAGYKELMSSTFFAANPGSSSRFFSLEFDDYTPEELFNIMLLKVRSKKSLSCIMFPFEGSVLTVLKKHLQEKFWYFGGNSGNARAAEKFLDLVSLSVTENFEERDVVDDGKSRKFLITEEDIEAGFLALQLPDTKLLEDFVAEAIIPNSFRTFSSFPNHEERSMDELWPWEFLYHSSWKAELVGALPSGPVSVGEDRSPLFVIRGQGGLEKVIQGTPAFICGPAGSGKSTMSKYLVFSRHVESSRYGLSETLRTVADVVIHINVELLRERLLEDDEVTVLSVLKAIYGSVVAEKYEAVILRRMGRVLWIWDGVESNFSFSGVRSNLDQFLLQLQNNSLPSFAPLCLILSRRPRTSKPYFEIAKVPWRAFLVDCGAPLWPLDSFESSALVTMGAVFQNTLHCHILSYMLRFLRKKLDSVHDFVRQACELFVVVQQIPAHVMRLLERLAFMALRGDLSFRNGFSVLEFLHFSVVNSEQTGSIVRELDSASLLLRSAGGLKWEFSDLIMQSYLALRHISCLCQDSDIVKVLKEFLPELDGTMAGPFLKFFTLWCLENVSEKEWPRVARAVVKCLCARRKEIASCYVFDVALQLWDGTSLFEWIKGTEVIDSLDNLLNVCPRLNCSRDIKGCSAVAYRLIDLAAFVPKINFVKSWTAKVQEIGDQDEDFCVKQFRRLSRELVGKKTPAAEDFLSMIAPRTVRMFRDEKWISPSSFARYAGWRCSRTDIDFVIQANANNAADILRGAIQSRHNLFAAIICLYLQEEHKITTLGQSFVKWTCELPYQEDIRAVLDAFGKVPVANGNINLVEAVVRYACEHMITRLLSCLRDEEHESLRAVEEELYVCCNHQLAEDASEKRIRKNWKDFVERAVEEMPDKLIREWRAWHPLAKLI